jgi:hypothetical protein
MWPMFKPMWHVNYISAMWHRSKWVPHLKMQLIINIAVILIARSLMYTLYGNHIRMQ